MKKLVALTLIAVFALVGFANLTAQAGGTSTSNVLVNFHDATTNAPISGGSITITGITNSYNVTKTTNSNGQAVFLNLPDGDYTVTATASGYQSINTVMYGTCGSCIFDLGSDLL